MWQVRPSSPDCPPCGRHDQSAAMHFPYAVLCSLVAVALPVSARAGYKMQSRSTTETCSNVLGALKIPGDIFPLGTISSWFWSLYELTLSLLTKLKGQCLCDSDVPAFVTSHAAWKGVEAAAETALTAMVCNSITALEIVFTQLLSRLIIDQLRSRSEELHVP